MKYKYFLNDDLAVIEKSDRIIIFNPRRIKPLFFFRDSRFFSTWKEIGKNKENPLPENVLSPDALRILEDNFIIHKGRKKDIRSYPGQPKVNHEKVEYSLYLNLVQYCNQRCLYCYNGESSYKKKQKLRMNEAAAKKAINAVLSNMRHGGNLRIIFYGGEPLLNWALAKKIIRYCRTLKKKGLGEKTISFQIVTNLVLFPSDLVKVAQRNDIFFAVCIDGPQDVHDKTRPLANGKASFQITTKNVKRLTKAGIKVFLRANITRYNQGRLLEAVRLHKRLGAGRSVLVALSIFDSDGRILSKKIYPSPEKVAVGLKKLYESKIWGSEKIYPFSLYLSRLRNGPEALRCKAFCGQKLTVDAEGNIFPCFLLLDRNDFKLGNLFDKRNFSLKKKNKIVEIIKKEDFLKCQRCAFRFYCNEKDCLSKKIFARDFPIIKNYNQKINCAIAQTVMGAIISSEAQNIGNL